MSSASVLDMIFRLEKRLLRLEKALRLEPAKEDLTHPKALTQFEAEEQITKAK